MPNHGSCTSDFSIRARSDEWQEAKAAHEWGQAVGVFCEPILAFTDEGQVVLLGKTPENRIFVEDVVRGQWSALERNVVMKQTARADHAKYGGLVYIWIEQEGSGGGKESAEYSLRDLAGYTVQVEPAVKDKEIRAEPLAAQAEAGNVFLIEGAWNAAFLDELCMFPNGRFNDQVDAASGAFNKLALGRSLFSDADRAASISSKIPLFVPQTRAEPAVGSRCLGG